jgi:hypothetical protein
MALDERSRAADAAAERALQLDTEARLAADSRESSDRQRVKVAQLRTLAARLESAAALFQPSSATLSPPGTAPQPDIPELGDVRACLQLRRPVV